MTENWYNRHLEPSVYLYTSARQKTHGCGPAPRRQALMLAIMGFQIVHQKNRISMAFFARMMPLFLKLLYARPIPLKSGELRHG